MIVPVSPCAAGAMVAAEETLAGASIASVGTELPSGRSPPASSALAVDAPAPARLTDQAAESSASGTSAVTLCIRVNAAIAGLSLRCWNPNAISFTTAQASNDCCHTEWCLPCPDVIQTTKKSSAAG